MSRFRHLSVFTLCAALIAATIVTNWGLLRSNSPGKLSRPSPLKVSYEEKVFSLQSKVFVGVLQFAEKQKHSAPSQNQIFDQLKKSMEESFKTSLKFEVDSHLAHVAKFEDPSRGIAPARMYLIVAKYLEQEELLDSLCLFLEETRSHNSQIEESTDLVLRICPNSQVTFDSTSNNQFLFSEEESHRIEQEFGWLGTLLLYSSAKGGDNEKHYAEALWRLVEKTMFKTGIGVLIFLGVGFLSLLSLFVFAIRCLGGKCKSQFEQKGIHADLCLEIFCLYLACMMLAPRLFEAMSSTFSGTTNLLKANVIFISLMSLIIFWPVLLGDRPGAVLDRIGFRSFGFKRLIGDSLLSPFVYFAALIPLLVVLLAYSALLMKLNIDPAQGAHPIVPIVTDSKNGSTVYLVIIMAVVVAPFVEEIMFRGALYSWLRSKTGTTISILISSVLFAAIHPQGAIGVLPLSCIGIVLAILREWRGNLTACMVTHACFNAGTLALVLFFLR